MKKARALSIATLAVLIGCAQTPEPVAEVPTRVENAELGIVIAALPSAFKVVTDSGPTIELESGGVNGPGRATIAAGQDERFGINLIEAVKARKAEFESAAGGEYFGNRELGSPIGTAFTARGAYDRDGSRVEELWIYAIHPTANRVLTITYQYPPGASEERAQHLLELLGEIEGM